MSTTNNVDDQFFVDFESDTLSLLSHPIGHSNYILLITNIISTYVTNSQKLYNLFHNSKIANNFDIIFIDESNKSIDEANAYRRIFPGFCFSFYVEYNDNF